MTKPISCFVVIAADARTMNIRQFRSSLTLESRENHVLGSVFSMPWKLGNIADNTTLAANPPQYDWIPKNMKLTKHCHHVSSVFDGENCTSDGPLACYYSQLCHFTCQYLLPDFDLHNKVRSVHSKCHTTDHWKTEVVSDLSSRQLLPRSIYPMFSYTGFTTDEGDKTSQDASYSDGANGRTGIETVSQVARAQSPACSVKADRKPRWKRRLDSFKNKICFLIILPVTTVCLPVVGYLIRWYGENIRVGPSAVMLVGRNHQGLERPGNS
jgi:hypothetical protein